jgi:hypothetical protein
VDRQTYLDRKGERLVVQGFRHWLSGYEFGDVACWEQAWSLFTNELGAVNAGFHICITGSKPFGRRRRNPCVASPASAAISAARNVSALA